MLAVVVVVTWGSHRGVTDQQVAHDFNMRLSNIWPLQSTVSKPRGLRTRLTLKT